MSRTGLLRSALRRPAAQWLLPVRATTAPATPAAARSFSHLPTLRPSPFASSAASIFRSPAGTTGTHLFAPVPSSSSSAAAAEASGSIADVVPKSAITTHPALSGVASQIRCGPRPTMSGATRLIQKRRHGFLSRLRTAKGRKILQRRRQKGRKRLGHA
ncbi:hypothetical protein VTJ83DRAFT_5761 [Remersonia thermophila]|uniref:50S ribosomal protein L34 n=1 Tax=Remersonia thermophila TaxID=72144 RepID=A0ABR4D7R6_9PEZI